MRERLANSNWSSANGTAVVLCLNACTTDSGYNRELSASLSPIPTMTAWDAVVENAVDVTAFSLKQSKLTSLVLVLAVRIAKAANAKRQAQAAGP